MPKHSVEAHNLLLTHWLPGERSEEKKIMERFVGRIVKVSCTSVASALEIIKTSGIIHDEIKVIFLEANLGHSGSSLTPHTDDSLSQLLHIFPAAHIHFFSGGTTHIPGLNELLKEDKGRVTNGVGVDHYGMNLLPSHLIKKVRVSEALCCISAPAADSLGSPVDTSPAASSVASPATLVASPVPVLLHSSTTTSTLLGTSHATSSCLVASASLSCDEILSASDASASVHIEGLSSRQPIHSSGGEHYFGSDFSLPPPLSGLALQANIMEALSTDVVRPSPVAFSAKHRSYSAHGSPGASETCGHGKPAISPPVAVFIKKAAAATGRSRMGFEVASQPGEFGSPKNVLGSCAGLEDVGLSSAFSPTPSRGNTTFEVKDKPPAAPAPANRVTLAVIAEPPSKSCCCCTFFSKRVPSPNPNPPSLVSAGGLGSC